MAIDKYENIEVEFKNGTIYKIRSAEDIGIYDGYLKICTKIGGCGSSRMEYYRYRMDEIIRYTYEGKKKKENEVFEEIKQLSKNMTEKTKGYLHCLESGTPIGERVLIFTVSDFKELVDLIKKLVK